jgi:hypothetical protein
LFVGEREGAEMDTGEKVENSEAKEEQQIRRREGGHGN